MTAFSTPSTSEAVTRATDDGFRFLSMTIKDDNDAYFLQPDLSKSKPG